MTLFRSSSSLDPEREIKPRRFSHDRNDRYSEVLPDDAETEADELRGAERAKFLEENSATYNGKQNKVDLQKRDNEHWVVFPEGVVETVQLNGHEAEPPHHDGIPEPVCPDVLSIVIEPAGIEFPDFEDFGHALGQHHAHSAEEREARSVRVLQDLATERKRFASIRRDLVCHMRFVKEDHCSAAEYRIHHKGPFPEELNHLGNIFRQRAFAGEPDADEHLEDDDDGPDVLLRGDLGFQQELAKGNVRHELHSLQARE